MAFKLLLFCALAPSTIAFSTRPPLTIKSTPRSARPSSRIIPSRPLIGSRISACEAPVEEEGWVQSGTGLRYLDMVEGDGDTAQEGDAVTVE